MPKDEFLAPLFGEAFCILARLWVCSDDMCVKA